MKMKIKKNDTVILLSGKDKGKTGVVEKAFPKENRVVVKGLNMVTRHLKPKGGQSGRIVKAEASIDASNVMFMDADKKPSRIGRQVRDGKNVRVAKKSGTALS